MEIHRDLAPLWNTSFFRAGDAPEPTSAFFLNDTIGWLAFQRGDIFRTSDGGNSWCQVADGNTLWPDRTRPAGFHALHFRSRLEGIGVGLNEGSMWTRAGLPETIRELSLHGDEGLAIGRSRALSGDLSLKNAASAISTTLLRGKDLVLRACIKTTGPRNPTSSPLPTPSTAPETAEGSKRKNLYLYPNLRKLIPTGATFRSARAQKEYVFPCRSIPSRIESPIPRSVAIGR
jgi:hypothetical protein